MVYMFIIFIYVGILLSQEIRVGMIEGHIDYKMLEQSLDLDLLKSTTFPSYYGKKSIYDVNEHSLNHQMQLFEKHLEFLDKKYHSKKKRDPSLLPLNLYYLQNSKMAPDLKHPIGSHSHGTHVASIILKNRKSKLVNFPVLESRGSLNIDPIFNLMPKDLYSFIKKKYSHISNTLKKNKIRIVNLSMGYQSFQKPPKILFMLLDKKLHEFGEDFAQIAYHYINEKILVELIKNNPQTIFVQAAGNEGYPLEVFGFHSAKHSLKNHIVVGSSHEDECAYYSNYSKKYVDIFANGSNVEGPFIGTNKKENLIGTSFAAPKIVNLLLEILEANPSISNDELLVKLYTHKKVKRSPKLCSISKSGRYLSECED